MSDVSNLAAQLASLAAPSGPQLSVSQAVITAWNASGTPPTVTLLLSGGSTPVDNVRYSDAYTPSVGDTVQVLKQSNQLFVFDHIANSADLSTWNTPTLQPGFSAGRPGIQPGVQWRSFTVAGQTKMEWKGAVSRTSGSSIIVGSGLPIVPGSTGRALGLMSDLGMIEVDFFSDECGLTSATPAWISFDGVNYYL